MVTLFPVWAMQATGCLGLNNRNTRRRANQDKRQKYKDKSIKPQDRKGLQDLHDLQDMHDLHDLQDLHDLHDLQDLE